MPESSSAWSLSCRISSQSPSLLGWFSTYDSILVPFGLALGLSMGQATLSSHHLAHRPRQLMAQSSSAWSLTCRISSQSPSLLRWLLSYDSILMLLWTGTGPVHWSSNLLCSHCDTHPMCLPTLGSCPACSLASLGSSPIPSIACLHVGLPTRSDVSNRPWGVHPPLRCVHPSLYNRERVLN